MREERDDVTAVINLYQKIKDTTNNGHVSMWLNLGLWKHTINVEKACEALFDKAIHQLGIKDGSRILDAGCGYGVQDVYLASRFPHVTISGINVVNFQIQAGEKLIRNKWLQDRITLLQEDAVATSFDDEQFDYIIAIESAFHFNTRKKFFDEAYRLLRIGGGIVLADCLPPEPFLINETIEKAARDMAIPIENYYNISKYVHYLEEVGFANIQVEEITDEVLPGAAMEMFSSGGWRSSVLVNHHISDKEKQELLNRFMEVTTIGKYYIVTAYK